MPFDIEKDGKTITVYDQHEFNEATKDLRIKVENETKAKYEPQISELTQKVTTLEPLQAQVTSLTQERDALKGERDGLQRTQTFTKVAREKGLADPVIDLALNHKGFDTVDLANTEALDAFLQPFSALTTPSATPAPKPAPGAGGSPTGGGATPLSADAIAAKVRAGDHTAVTGDAWQQTLQTLDFSH